MAPKQSKVAPVPKSRPVKSIEKWGNGDRQRAKSEWKHFSARFAKEGSEQAMPILRIYCCH